MRKRCRDLLWCGSLLVFMAAISQSSAAQAGSLTGDWLLNYPAGEEPVTWTFSQEGADFAGTATVTAQQTTTDCQMQGSSLFGLIYLADIECVTQPIQLVTTGKALFIVQENTLSGVAVTFIEGLPVGIVDLTGTKVVVEPPPTERVSRRRR